MKIELDIPLNQTVSAHRINFGGVFLGTDGKFYMRITDSVCIRPHYIHVVDLSDGFTSGLSGESPVIPVELNPVRARRIRVDLVPYQGFEGIQGGS